MGYRGKLRGGLPNRIAARRDGKKNNSGTSVVRVFLTLCGVASISFSILHFALEFQGPDPNTFQRHLSKEYVRATEGRRLASSFNLSNQLDAGSSLKPEEETSPDKPAPSNKQPQLPQSNTPLEQQPLAADQKPRLPKSDVPEDGGSGVVSVKSEPVQPAMPTPPPTPLKQQKQEQQPVVAAAPTQHKQAGQLDLPQDASFNKAIFEQRLNAFRHLPQEAFQERYQRSTSLAAAQPSTSNSNSTLHIVPYLYHTAMFQKKHMSWDLMVMVMADNVCPLTTTNDDVGSFNATSRLLNTLHDALRTEMVQVIAYLPHYFQGATTDCHMELFQAVVSTFPTALNRGQLQIVSSPQLEKKRPPVYHYAFNGLDFAYAAELGNQYADLVLFLQAGSRLTKQWWLQETPTGDGELTTNRDYAWEIMKAYENRQQQDGKGLIHELCYMNFAKRGGTRNKGQAPDMENPTGVLFESAQLMRLALLLRSYAPYGKFPVSELLNRYCRDLLWEPFKPNGSLLLFEYDAKVPTQAVGGVERRRVLPTMTYPYVTLTPNEVPSWVQLHPSMVGPQPAGQGNPFLTSRDTSTAQVLQNTTTANEQNWMTFVIPTAWRHQASHSRSTRLQGNTYIINCLRQLTEVIQTSFQNKFKANVLVFVSGRDQADIAMHRAGLEAEFGSQIQEGMIKLVDAPLTQYPALDGLHATYGDPEHQVKWRSKQMLDISAALFAAKGMGKYVMVIEDDSGFRPKHFLDQVRKEITDLQHQYSPKDGKTYGLDATPGETELGHRELWSQVRFSFGYSGVLIHDEDLFVFAMMHFVLYKEKPCDLLFYMADSVRNGFNKDHPLRWKKKERAITHEGQMSTLNGKAFTEKEMIADALSWKRTRRQQA